MVKDIFNQSLFLETSQSSLIFLGLMLGSISAMEVSPQNALVETIVEEDNQNEQGVLNPEVLNAF
ncbi:hypothetical protein FC756_25785 [Lysinibacillus mangiferihumi]|uniref:Uncharacterized protein n=1 Tax=Lysinibacillus mangiferihumi TaxID=1130819 RepID=A0A4U2XYS8_9BACI|nr:hypothetical protein [Lysinibacillus mangiferihumi]TKI53099.1 hypothetical protein FC756_25785 [Lysinibacillus mangiferihumi]